MNEGIREDWIDLVKCIGICLVVMSHLDLSIPYFVYFTSLFFVPVFFMVSGYTYRTGNGNLFDFVKRKGRRLLLPYFLYSFFFYFFYSIKTGQFALRPLAGIFYSRMFLYPPSVEQNILFLTVWNSPLWYLTAMFVSLLLFELCLRFSRGDDKKLVSASAVCLAIGVLLIKNLKILLPWSLESAFLFEGIVCLGYLVRRHNTLEVTAKKTILAVLLIPVLLFMGYANAPAGGAVNVSVGDFGRFVPAGVLNAALSSAVVIYLCHLCRRQVPVFLAEMGRSSLTIMCLHLFGYMFIKTVFEAVLGINIEGYGAAASMCRVASVIILLGGLTLFDIIAVRGLSSRIRRHGKSGTC